MISLFLDTCNHNIVIGLLNDNKLISSNIFSNDNNLSEKLLPSIKQLLDKNKINIKELKKVFISVGPGSFTGIRIGVTVAKTIAWSLKIDIIPISSLEIIASTNTDSNYICSLVDARRGYVYGGLYDNDLNPVINDKYVKLDELLSIINNSYPNVDFISYEPLFDIIKKPNIDIEKIVNKHINDESINPHSVNPIYLKKTEAEEKHDQGN
jgi:tRNA threonylcarbamoyl adenosine modification protein YeaZ